MDVLVIATGGTIASTETDRGSGPAPELTGEELVSSVPELNSYADLTVETIADRPGFDVSPAVCARIARRIHRSDADGIIVTHGTDTLAETARYLDLTCEMPIVVTGAQRRPDERGSDGGPNLLTAVRALAQDQIDRGAFVAFDGELHASATVRKSHTCSLDTFQSPDSGPIARFTRQQVYWYRETTREPETLPIPDPKGHPTVPLVFSASGMDAAAFKDATARGDGVVVAGTGLGNVTTDLGEAIADATSPVVVASRCHAGPTEPVYGTPGGAATLAKHDHVRFADGTPWGVRIELLLALASDCVDERFKRFDG